MLDRRNVIAGVGAVAATAAAPASASAAAGEQLERALENLGAMLAGQVATMLFLLSPGSANLTGFATDGGFTTY